jgi:uncharacterized protein YraI
MGLMTRSVQAHVLSAYLSIAVLAAPFLGLAEPARMGVITGDGVTMRAGPGVTSDKVGRLMTGDWVTILESAGEWYKILDPHGQPAWVFARWVDEVPMESQTPGAGPLSVTTVEAPEAAPSDTAAAPPPLIEHHQRHLPWLWIGAGTLAVGVVGALALSAGDDESSAGSLSFHVEFP